MELTFIVVISSVLLRDWISRSAASSRVAVVTAKLLMELTFIVVISSVLLRDVMALLALVASVRALEAVLEP
jgi:hypothetical protein